MKRLLRYANMAVTLLMTLILTSCEEKTGYYDEGQLNRIKTLTGVNWVKHNVWHDSDNNTIDGYETWNFETTGNGSHSVRNEQNDKVIYNSVEYFHWTFTTDNMAVIYMSIPDCGDTFWLIDRLTTTELCVNQASQDPVLFPGTHQNYEKYSATPKQR